MNYIQIPRSPYSAWYRAAFSTSYVQVKNILIYNSTMTNQFSELVARACSPSPFPTRIRDSFTCTGK